MRLFKQVWAENSARLGRENAEYATPQLCAAYLWGWHMGRMSVKELLLSTMCLCAVIIAEIKMKNGMLCYFINFSHKAE